LNLGRTPDARSAAAMGLDSFFDVWLFQPGKPTSW
jgi:hypothetical protein